MKKFALFMLVLLCLVPTAFSKVDTNPLFYLDGVEKVCFVSERNLQSDDVESVQSGDLFFNYCSLETARENFKSFKLKLKGLQFYFENFDAEKILKQLKCEVLTTTEIEGMKVLCGFTPYYDDNILLNNHKVNVQIAQTENGVVVGFPLILTGY